jgi:DNA-binding GntR family transcriptional regulator
MESCMQTSKSSLTMQAAPPASSPQTRAAELAGHLGDDIIHARLAPGVRLDEQDLARRFGVSRTPVREALRQLVATGLAEHRPRRGVIVANISGAQLDEMFFVMAELEAAAARLAATAMRPAERHEFEAFHQASQAAVHHGRTAEYEKFNVGFHSRLYEGSHNVYLRDLLNATRARLAPFRRAQFNLLGRLTSSWREHDVVVRAVLRGDGEAAAQAMRAHVLTVSVASAEYVAFQTVLQVP